MVNKYTIPQNIKQKNYKKSKQNKINHKQKKKKKQSIFKN